ncbi:MAG: dUTP diphosphatase [Romboutsia timonensis]
MATKQVKIMKIRDNAKLPESKNGNWYDCYSSMISRIPKNEIGMRMNWLVADDNAVQSGTIAYGAGDIIVVYLGFATDIGKGYEGHLLPRSSTFTNYGLIQGNSEGLIDDTYCGDGDEWKLVFYATRPGVIRVGERIAQMSIVKSNKFDLVEVDTLGNEDRGGYGSTGTN